MPDNRHRRSTHYPSSSFNSSSKDGLRNQSQFNDHLHDLLEFYIPSEKYEIIFVNRDIPMERLNAVLSHVSHCHQYSIDTEAEKNNQQLALIQINTIPIEEKSLVLLFELQHLPNQSQPEYDKVLQILCSIFRQNNEVYSWGEMKRELEPARNMLTWPVLASLIDLQPHFATWYDVARTRCSVRGLSGSPCQCHRSSPYKATELWSLEKAYRYGCRMILDKSYRLSHWSASLSSSSSTLSDRTRRHMVRYAVYDVLAVTYLIRPITEAWSFTRIEERSMHEIFKAFQSTKLPTLTTTKSKKQIKNISLSKLAKALRPADLDEESMSSEDEIYMERLIEPVTTSYQREVQGEGDRVQVDVQVPMDVAIDLRVGTPENIRMDIHAGVEELATVDNHIVVVDETSYSPEEQQRRTRTSKRSAEGRRKKNKKRNVKKRLNRYKHSFTRPYYYRVKSSIARNILKYYAVRISHIKVKNKCYVIGTHTGEERRKYERSLPYECFNKQHYERFR